MLRNDRIQDYKHLAYPARNTARRSGSTLKTLTRTVFFALLCLITAVAIVSQAIPGSPAPAKPEFLVLHLPGEQAPVDLYYSGILRHNPLQILDPPQQPATQPSMTTQSGTTLSPVHLAMYDKKHLPTHQGTQMKTPSSGPAVPEDKTPPAGPRPATGIPGYSFAHGRIRSSLYEDGINAGIPYPVIMEMAAIFAWDIDFAMDLRKGDSFAVLYRTEAADDDGHTPRILAAEFVNRGKSYTAVYYRNKTGHAGYYTSQGISLRKAFLRNPVKYRRISSYFNLRRRHPVLNRIRAHKGVDYAAPTGTPVRATGDGKIIWRGRKGGYGKTLIIRHGRKYTTLYAHLSAYRPGLRTGKRVRQGDVIGYIGATGLATGPHLHYEFRVYGRHHNPLTVKLPKARALSRRRQKDFFERSKYLLGQLARLQNRKLVLGSRPTN